MKKSLVVVYMVFNMGACNLEYPAKVSGQKSSSETQQVLSTSGTLAIDVTQNQLLSDLEAELVASGATTGEEAIQLKIDAEEYISKMGSIQVGGTAGLVSSFYPKINQVSEAVVVVLGKRWNDSESQAKKNAILSPLIKVLLKGVGTYRPANEPVDGVLLSDISNTVILNLEKAGIIENQSVDAVEKVFNTSLAHLKEANVEESKLVEVTKDLAQGNSRILNDLDNVIQRANFNNALVKTLINNISNENAETKYLNDSALEGITKGILNSKQVDKSTMVKSFGKIISRQYKRKFEGNETKSAEYLAGLNKSFFKAITNSTLAEGKKKHHLMYHSLQGLAEVWADKSSYSDDEASLELMKQIISGAFSGLFDDESVATDAEYALGFSFATKSVTNSLQHRYSDLSRDQIVSSAAKIITSSLKKMLEKKNSAVGLQMIEYLPKALVSSVKGADLTVEEFGKLGELITLEVLNSVDVSLGEETIRGLVKNLMMGSVRAISILTLAYDFKVLDAIGLRIDKAIQSTIKAKGFNKIVPPTYMDQLRLAFLSNITTIIAKNHDFVDDALSETMDQVEEVEVSFESPDAD